MTLFLYSDTYMGQVADPERTTLAQLKVGQVQEIVNSYLGKVLSKQTHRTTASGTHKLDQYPRT